MLLHSTGVISTGNFLSGVISGGNVSTRLLTGIGSRTLDVCCGQCDMQISVNEAYK